MHMHAIIMSLAAGQPGHKAPPRLWKAAADRISTAFEQIWHARVMHGDIAARNIGLSDEGQPLVGDFESAQLRDDLKCTA